jgi:hypothetical protein
MRDRPHVIVTVDIIIACSADAVHADILPWRNDSSSLTTGGVLESQPLQFRRKDFTECA